MYQACPSPDCNKKVVDQQNGLYRCEKCDNEFPNFKYRMMLLVSKWKSVLLAPFPCTIQTEIFPERKVLEYCDACGFEGIEMACVLYLSEGCFIELISSLFS